jgi:hypothetical protein
LKNEVVRLKAQEASLKEKLEFELRTNMDLRQKLGRRLREGIIMKKEFIAESIIYKSAATNHLGAEVK